MPQFKPGECGNPGGRPKVDPAIRKLCEAECINSIKTLIELRDSTSTPPNIRALAANSLLDRGLGKPRQELDIEHSGEVNVFINRKPKDG